MSLLKIDQGDDETINITAVQPDGVSPLDLSGCKLWFYVKANETDDDADALLRKDSDDVGGDGGITIEAPTTAGLATVTVSQLDTTGFAAEHLKRPLYWALQVKDSQDNIITLARGFIAVKPDLITATA